MNYNLVANQERRFRFSLAIKIIREGRKLVQRLSCQKYHKQIKDIIARYNNYIVHFYRWFRHISEATEAYKHVIKNNSAKDSDFRNEVVNKTMQVGNNEVKR